MTEAAIAAAARRFVGAWHRVIDADPRHDLATVIEHDAAFHALIVQVDGWCSLCDVGTCPLQPQTIDVIDQAGRL